MPDLIFSVYFVQFINRFSWKMEKKVETYSNFWEKSLDNEFFEIPAAKNSQFKVIYFDWS